MRKPNLTLLGVHYERTNIYSGGVRLRTQAALPQRRPPRRRHIQRGFRSVASLRAARTKVRGNRSYLLPRLEVHGRPWRAGHLRAGLVPVFAMHRRAANLLPAPGVWPAMFCQALPRFPLFAMHRRAAILLPAPGFWPAMFCQALRRSPRSLTDNEGDLFSRPDGG